MDSISVVINTLNEEKNLPRALLSVKDIASEIVVVDMHSSDATVEIAKKAGAKIFEHAKTGYVEPARNFAVSKATNKWILVIDADEELPKALGKKLHEIVEKNKVDYVRIPRKNIIFNKWLKHSRWWPDYNIRFFKKGFVSWNEIIHTVPVTQGRGIDLAPEEDLSIVHHNFETIEEYLETQIVRYPSIKSRELVQDGYQFRWQDLISKPSNEFLSRYFQGEGYKDGIHGLALAVLQAFAEALLYLYVWQHQKFKDEKINTMDMIRELESIQRDMNYWKEDTIIKEGGGLIHKFKRKFKFA